MKIRKRLSEEKALQLGLKVKPIEKCGKNPRYYLTEKQVAQLGDVKKRGNKQNKRKQLQRAFNTIRMERQRQNDVNR